MAKSPAFLFYTNDFISGTQFFTNEEVGIYIRLLAAQHQHGRLSEKQVKIICNSIDNEVLNKFEIDEHGLYFNVRLEEEIEKRQKFSESRSTNRKGKIKETKSKKTSKSYVNHMENENEIEIDNKDDYTIALDNFIEMRKKMRKPLTDHALDLIKKELENLAPNNKPKQVHILNQSTMNGWLSVFELKVSKQKDLPLAGADIRGINIDNIKY
jgi:uncharacterized protein YdaU (DUF1376 family)